MPSEYKRRTGKSEAARKTGRLRFAPIRNASCQRNRAWKLNDAGYFTLTKQLAGNISPVCGPNHLPPATANSADFRKPSTRISFGGVFMKHRGTVLSIFAGVLLFAVAASAQTYTALHTYPIGSGNYSGVGWPQVMSQGRDGLLYSTISNDGTKNVGTVFNITTAGQLNTIYSFCPLTGCADGASPLGGVTLGFDGNFYGTTQGGGSHGAGTVFKGT